MIVILSGVILSDIYCNSQKCNAAPAESSPLDLSGSSPPPPPAKRPRAESSASSPASASAVSAEAVLRWSIDDVVEFVESIEICKEYAEVSDEPVLCQDAGPMLDHRLFLKNISTLK